MGRNYYPSPRNRQVDNKDAFIDVKARIPKSTFERLKDFSNMSGESYSRLIAYAIDNEFDLDHPFNYDCTTPNIEYVENQYIEDAKKIVDFIKERGVGVQVSCIVLCRKDFGIETRDRVMLAIRELINAQVVRVVKRHSMCQGNRDMLYIDSVDPRELKKNRYKPPTLRDEE